MNNVTFGFIGTGNMGGALARAASRKLSPESIFLSNRTPAKSEALACEIGAHFSSNNYIAENCGYIFLGVKPQAMPDLLAEISPLLQKRAGRFILVSMAAGLSISDIQDMAGGNYPTIRIMPNTPASIGNGMVLYTCSSDVTSQEIDTFKECLCGAGCFDELPEHLIDAGSAISGCGPAFVYMFIEALADGGVECGLPRDKAILYAAQTLCGASRLVIESGIHPGALKDAVCSPGGTTIAGVHALESRGFRACAIDAVTAAFEKTKLLGKK